MPEHTARHVRLFKGHLSPSNSAVFFQAVVEDCNRVVGLELHIEPPTTDPESFTISHDEPDKLILWKKTDPVSSTELNINEGFRWEHGGWTVDGFYLVKPGGTFQGTSCFGLLPVDEAQLRLNPAVRLIPVAL